MSASGPARRYAPAAARDDGLCVRFPPDRCPPDPDDAGFDNRIITGRRAPIAISPRNSPCYSRGRPAGAVPALPPAVSRGPPPEPGVLISGHRALHVSGRWSAAGGGCRFRCPRGRDGVTAIAVAGHGDAGCAGEHGPVVGEPPARVAETTAELGHSKGVFAGVLGSRPAHQP